MANRRAKRMKFETRGYKNCIVRRVLFMFDSLSSVWRHSVHFTKFSMARFFKTLFLPHFSSNFNQTFWKVWESDVGVMGVAGYLLILGDLSNFKHFIYWHFDIFNAGPYGAGNFKAYFYNFHLTKFMKTLATMVE